MRRKGSDYCQSDQLIHMHLSFYKTFYSVKDNRCAEQDCGGHCQKLSVETAAAVKELSDAAIYQQYPPCQRSQQGYANADLLAVSMLDSNFIFEV